MSYETALKIVDVVNDIHQKKYLLPSIQREFVWNDHQIKQLFDSLMRDYPIGAFLFWVVSGENVQDFQFYEFLREYHERDNRHNPKANTSGEEEITAILDGQQRLTALYIALRGSYAHKLPRKRWDNDLAYPKQMLYLNILHPSNESDLEYDFDFLTEEEAAVCDAEHFWFQVNDILDMRELSDVNEYLFNTVNEYLIQQGIYDKDKMGFANRSMSKLYSTIHIEKTISYYLEKTTELDKVLNIFIRVNSGGTQLSYSDLLLSIATTQWEDKDAREEITQFVSEINGIGSGFRFTKDFVLKTCLVLSDLPDIAFKVDNFNKKNMLIIERNWEQTETAIRLAVILVSSFGYSRENLPSHHALIPIAYYLQKLGLPRNFHNSALYLEDRKRIKQWLIRSLLKKVFGGISDNYLNQIRSIIYSAPEGNFPLDALIQRFRVAGRTSIAFNDEDIENIMSYKYGQSYTFSALSLLYPALDFTHKFHTDHIYPKSAFSISQLRKRGIPTEKIEEYTSCYNYLPNLQILSQTENIEKQNIDFDVWLNQVCQTNEDYIAFQKLHLTPKMDLGFENFLEFFDRREELMFTRFKELLE